MPLFGMAKPDEQRFPELLVERDAAARREIMNAIRKRRGVRYMTQLWSLLAALIAMLVAIGLFFLVNRLARDIFMLRGWSLRAMLIIAIPFAAYLGGRLGNARLRRLVWRELAVRGYPICGTCGYSMLGAPTQRCPECGTEFDAAGIPKAATRRDEPDQDVR